MKSWLVKVNRYGGGESIVASCNTQAEAEEIAAARNAEYQTDTYVVEAYDPARAAKFPMTGKIFE